MKDVMEVVGDWVGAGDPVALATVVDTKKSAPQPPGTKMAVNEAGRMAGAVSGGCVEGQVVQVAEGDKAATLTRFASSTESLPASGTAPKRFAAK